MRWRFRIGIIVTGMAFFLVGTVSRTPVSLAHTQAVLLGAATLTTIMVQATPTEDATVTALNKEQLAQQVAGQQHTLGNWLWSNVATILSSFLSTLVVVIGALLGFWQWRVGRMDTQKKESDNQKAAQDKESDDRKAERERRVEERFQAAVTGLGDDKEGVRIGAIILLRTFLRSGYEQFYVQTFDLAVANLRLPRTTHSLADPVPEEESDDDLESYQELDDDPESYQEPEAPLLLTTLSHALNVVFKDAFPRARDSLKKQEDTFRPEFLDASRIQLDNAYLAEADLSHAWMPQVFLRKANLSHANLSGMNLSRANLMWANLSNTDLSHANLSGTQLYLANLSHANLCNANLSEAFLNKADLSDANLCNANLSGAQLHNADLSDANLSDANLTETRLIKANLNDAKLSNVKLSKTKFSESYFSGANLSHADLSGTRFSRVNFYRANLSHADLSKIEVFVHNERHSMINNKTNFNDANLSGANLSGAILHQTDFSEANLNDANLSDVTFTQTNIEDAQSLANTNLHGVKGLTREQLAVCKVKGAIIDEELTPGAPVSPLQSKDAQTPSVPPAQERTSPPDPNGSTIPSPQQELES